MRIEYTVTKGQREVSDAIGHRLIANRIARAVYPVRDMRPEGDREPVPPVNADPSEGADVASEDISPRTGKPKRKYKRRDMVAEG